jgi:hypothetical protein
MAESDTMTEFCEFEPISIASDQGHFAIRPYRPGDERDILQLFRKVFGQDRSLDHWRWKFLDNPYGTQIMLCVAPNGDLAAQYAGVPAPATLNSQKVQVTQLIDSMSDPAYRGVLGGRKGIFVRTVQSFFDTYAHPAASVFLYGFPGIRHFRLGELLLRYGRMDTGEFHLSKECTPRRRGFRLFFQGRAGPAQLPFQEDMDEFWDKKQRSFAFSVGRGSRFLNWRIANPDKTYQCWKIHSLLGNTLKGYALIQVLQQEAKARLIDLLVSDNFCGHALLADLEDYVLGLGCQTLESWASPNHPAYRTLLAYGFTPGPAPMAVVPTGRSFWHELDFAWAASHFAYTMADCDLF